MFKLKKVIMMGIFTVLVIGAVQVEAHPTDAQHNEEGYYRAFWVQAFAPGLKTPEEIDQLVEDVSQANMNAIVAQVSRRHDAYYRSDVLPFTEDPAVPQGFDPLGYLIEKAREKGIEVHAWVVVGPMWHPIYGGEPQDPNHIWNLHGPDAADDQTWVTRGYDGSVGNRMQPYLDLGHPDARDHVVEMVTDIVRNYDVDGVHLDYIRYPENAAGNPKGWYGYNPTSLQRFQEETGRTDRPDPADPHWLEWKTEQVNTLVKRVYLEMMAIDSAAKLTAAVVSWGFDDPRHTEWWAMDPVQRAHQDWKRWVQEGYLDYAFVMNYDPDADPTRAARYDAWIEWQKDLPRNRGIVIGPALYLNAPKDSLSQIQRALQPSPAGRHAEGISLYVYNVWSNDSTPRGEIIQMLHEATDLNNHEPPFAAPVPVPEPAWKKAPHGHLLGQVLQGEGKMPLSGVHVLLRRGNNGPVAAELLTDANGYFSVTDLKPGNYRVEINGHKHAQQLTIKPRQVTRAELTQ
ncbi:uncharacterized lipoprotein YddW (UPF0748 family) [Caldalkalibacillus uzonensis]|uniref:Uncharacterized lipoprotein YddW (UPF0748 family) n=1 Tax=Caldalkalibacillus uzonensis TaxID=353224 RepID=A0ABU0CW00_9BACI|nr:family 10 glycosylhydrolase [Caldalkalibacillus uzonensis]MDQ0340024.1 uncharacterized lipoprotein YddW (UPF0748 family) [Caldalkalibacillus uzonensis]